MPALGVTNPCNIKSAATRITAIDLVNTFNLQHRETILQDPADRVPSRPFRSVRHTPQVPSSNCHSHQHRDCTCRDRQQLCNKRTVLRPCTCPSMLCTSLHTLRIPEKQLRPAAPPR